MKEKVCYRTLSKGIQLEASPGYKKESCGIWKTRKQGIWETIERWVSMDEIPNYERRGEYLSSNYKLRP